MGLFKKKADPISSRARALNNEIAALESEIKRLSGNLDQNRPNVRSTADPRVPPAARRTAAAAREPIFEPVARAAPAEADASDAHFNDLGVRKYDLLGAWRRLRAVFGAAEAANPKLVSYLAAGSIRGLRPLRYEKRVARNRFIVLTLFFLLVLWGILSVIFNRH